MTFVQARPWIGTACRIVVGIVFVVAGATKVGDLAASGRAVAAYRLLPHELATFVGAVLPFLEIALGLLLIVGLATRFTAAVTGVVLVLFIAGIVSAWARGLRIDCGCFGTGGDLTGDEQPQYLSEIFRDIALVAAAGFLVMFPWTRLSLDSRLDLDSRPDLDSQLDGGRDG